MLTGNRSILFAFALIFNVRLLTELPRALNLMGWRTIPDGDYNRLFSTLLLAFCLLCIVFKKKIVIPYSLTQVIIFVSIFLLISTGFAVHTFLSNNMPLNGIFVVLLRYLIEIVIAIFIINFVKDEVDLQTVFAFFFKPALFLFILLSFLQIATSKYGDVQGVDRILGPFGSPTTLAGFLHLFIALTFYYFEGNHSYKFWMLLFIQYVLLIYTGSVATILANFAFVLLVAYKQRWIRLKVFYRIFPLVSAITIVAVVLKMESILSRLSVIFDLRNFELARGSSLKWRWDAWVSYLSLLDNSLVNWLFGLGVGAQRFILHPNYPNSLWRIFDAPGTHNDYLAMLIDFGLVGLFFFICGLIVLLKVIRNAEKQDKSLYFIRFYFITVLFIMLSENFIDQLIMFVFIMFLTAIIRAKKSDMENSLQTRQG